ncbi:MAG: hypothetical protein ACKO23_09985, partial [Gemmataceae bacterium]
MLKRGKNRRTLWFTSALLLLSLAAILGMVLLQDQRTQAPLSLRYGDLVHTLVASKSGTGTIFRK